VRRAIQDFAWALALSVLVLLCLAAIGHAQVGVAHGIGPHLSNPLTPHIGRVYYKPGDKASHKAEQELSGDDALHSWVSDYGKAKHASHEASCAKLHADYISRHGATTPRPLKGYHGCEKYAKDNGYWKVRHGEQPSIPNPEKQLTSSIHDATVDSVPYQLSGVFSLTSWNHF
jgi:hypothetical protein